jgi:protein TonB
MFESVAPETFVPRSRKVFYETLPLSIGLHLVIGAAFIVAGVWQVKFPLNSPKMLATYNLEELPTPPPPPPPPAAAAKVPVKTQQVAVKMPDVAPTIIPDAIPEVRPTPVNLPEVPITDGVVGGVEGGVEDGVAGGSLAGVEGGELGGSDGGIVGSVAPPGTVIVKRDMPLPMAPMSMTFPKYPEEARVRGWEDLVVVRYIIGKDGRVRDVQILAHPERDLFEKVTVKAIRNWRFRPYRKDGEPMEVIHELSIYFKLEA